LGDRLTVGQQPLELFTQVRILVPQLELSKFVRRFIGKFSGN
jgi:hypothetical protein